jgi:hypothetical protein
VAHRQALRQERPVVVGELKSELAFDAVELGVRQSSVDLAAAEFGQAARRRESQLSTTIHGHRRTLADPELFRMRCADPQSQEGCEGGALVGRAGVAQTPRRLPKDGGSGLNAYTRTVSYAVEARRVQDTSLPYAWRVGALRQCVSIYHPIGYHASLSFLREIAGPYERDAMSLARALDQLTRSRESAKAEKRRYAADRRQAKWLGRRTVSEAEWNPFGAWMVWYGAARAAALFGLRFGGPWVCQPVGPVDASVVAAVNELVRSTLSTGGQLSLPERDNLAVVESRLRSIFASTTEWPSPAGSGAYRGLRWARLVRVAVEGESVRGP